MGGGGGAAMLKTENLHCYDKQDEALGLPSVVHTRQKL